VISLLTIASVGTIGSLYFSPYAWRFWCASALRRQVIKDRTIVLTYDDGPTAAVTPELLDVLAHYRAKATFFMLGRNAERHMDIANRVFAEGHDIGCHSYQHLNAWKVVPWTAISDISAGYNKLSSWCPPDGMYRPPFGKITLPTYLAVRCRGATIGWWTIASGDTYNPLPRSKQVVDRLLREGGGIILMHDSHRSKERNDFVIETTTLLLEAASREGFVIKRLGELSH